MFHTPVHCGIFRASSFRSIGAQDEGEMGITSWLWWGGEQTSTDALQEKRDQVLNFLENELDLPAISSQVEEVGHACMFVCLRTSATRNSALTHEAFVSFMQVLNPMLPEVLAACRRLNVNILSDADDFEGGYALIDETASTPRPWDVLSKIKTEYLNCVNGIAFQNEQIGLPRVEPPRLTPTLMPIASKRGTAVPRRQS
jgi:hypothetical protein